MEIAVSEAATTKTTKLLMLGRPDGAVRRLFLAGEYENVSLVARNALRGREFTTYSLESYIEDNREVVVLCLMQRAKELALQGAKDDHKNPAYLRQYNLAMEVAGAQVDRRQPDYKRYVWWVADVLGRLNELYGQSKVQKVLGNVT
jgi:hypothetical protein